MSTTRIEAVIFDWGGTLTRWHDVDFHAESVALAQAVRRTPSPDDDHHAHAEKLHRAGEVVWGRSRDHQQACQCRRTDGPGIVCQNTGIDGVPDQPRKCQVPGNPGHQQHQSGRQQPPNTPQQTGKRKIPPVEQIVGDIDFRILVGYGQLVDSFQQLPGGRHRR